MKRPRRTVRPRRAKEPPAPQEPIAPPTPAEMEQMAALLDEAAAAEMNATLEAFRTGYLAWLLVLAGQVPPALQAVGDRLDTLLRMAPETRTLAAARFDAIQAEADLLLARARPDLADRAAATGRPVRVVMREALVTAGILTPEEGLSPGILNDLGDLGAPGDDYPDEEAQ